MAGKVLNIKVCSPLKLRSGLTGNYHAICHYSYNLPLRVADRPNMNAVLTNPDYLWGMRSIL
jgi:hypothetical protein